MRTEVRRMADKSRVFEQGPPVLTRRVTRTGYVMAGDNTEVTKGLSVRRVEPVQHRIERAHTQ